MSLPGLTIILMADPVVDEEKMQAFLETPGLTRGPAVLWGPDFIQKGEYKVSMQAATQIKVGLLRMEYLDLLTSEMPIMDTLVTLGYKEINS